MVGGDGIEREFALELGEGLLLRPAASHEVPQRARGQRQVSGYGRVLEVAIIGGEEVELVIACQRRTKLSLFRRCRCPSFNELFISRARHDCWLRREATRCLRRTISLNRGRARRYSPEPAD